MRLFCPECGTTIEDGEVDDVCRTVNCDNYGGKLYRLGPSEDPLVGVTLDERFRLDWQIGEGGMGAVYRATQLSVGRQVAVKLLRPDIADGEREAALGRFFREAKLISELSHPNIVRLIEFGQDRERDLLYLVMELVQGASLNDLLERGRFRANFALEVAYQICGALTEPHNDGVIHRDLKPENLLLVPVSDGTIQAKVLDFGIARALESTTQLTQTGMVCGTPAYMAPEQSRDHDLDARTDLYALGVIVYEMLAGEPPFTGQSSLEIMLRHIEDAPSPIREMLPPGALPQDVERLVYMMMSKDREARPRSARRVRDRIEAIRRAHDLDPIRIDEDTATSMVERIAETTEERALARQIGDDDGDEHSKDELAEIFSPWILPKMPTGSLTKTGHTEAFRRESALFEDSTGDEGETADAADGRDANGPDDSSAAASSAGDESIAHEETIAGGHGAAEPDTVLIPGLNAVNPLPSGEVLAVDNPETGDRPLVDDSIAESSQGHPPALDRKEAVDTLEGGAQVWVPDSDDSTRGTIAPKPPRGLASPEGRGEPRSRERAREFAESSGSKPRVADARPSGTGRNRTMLETPPDRTTSGSGPTPKTRGHPPRGSSSTHDAATQIEESVPTADAPVASARPTAPSPPTPDQSPMPTWVKLSLSSAAIAVAVAAIAVGFNTDLLGSGSSASVQNGANGESAAVHGSDPASDNGPSNEPATGSDSTSPTDHASEGALADDGADGTAGGEAHADERDEASGEGSGSNSSADSGRPEGGKGHGGRGASAGDSDGENSTSGAGTAGDRTGARADDEAHEQSPTGTEDDSIDESRSNNSDDSGDDARVDERPADRDTPDDSPDGSDEPTTDDSTASDSPADDGEESADDSEQVDEQLDSFFEDGALRRE